MRYRVLAAVVATLAQVSSASAQEAMKAPLPAALSPEARQQIALFTAAPSTAKPSIEQMRAMAEAIQVQLGAQQRKRYAVTIADDVIAGVPVRVITPEKVRDASVVLLNLHGGGFQVDSGSLSENIPLAALTGYTVVAVRYRLAPEHPFPAAADDAAAVYRALLKTHAPDKIALYGTSAGAMLTPEVALRLRAEKLPLPAALGLFATDGDLARPGDTATIFAPPMPLDLNQMNLDYAGSTPLDDPALSPIYADLTGLPPTLCLSSSRDFFLSSTANLCRRFDAAGAPTRLIVFDGLPHAFWAYIQAPESDEAFATMARFFTDALGKPAKSAR